MRESCCNVALWYDDLRSATENYKIKTTESNWLLALLHICMWHLPVYWGRWCARKAFKRLANRFRCIRAHIHTHTHARQTTVSVCTITIADKPATFAASALASGQCLNEVHFCHHADGDETEIFCILRVLFVFILPSLMYMSYFSFVFYLLSTSAETQHKAQAERRRNEYNKCKTRDPNTAHRKKNKHKKLKK